jgi:hypothetical protein
MCIVKLESLTYCQVGEDTHKHKNTAEANNFLVCALIRNTTGYERVIRRSPYQEIECTCVCLIQKYHNEDHTLLQLILKVLKTQGMPLTKPAVDVARERSHDVRP